MGEGIIEATLTRWLKNIGDTVSVDEAIVEIATDKVDTEIASPGEGILTEILVQEGTVAAVGSIIGVIASQGEAVISKKLPIEKTVIQPVEKITQIENAQPQKAIESLVNKEIESDELNIKFISPLVRSMAKAENISTQEIANINGTGDNGRVTKSDLLSYIQSRKNNDASNASVNIDTSDEIIEMDRMRRLIADHMVMSVKVSPHVTSFAEADVSGIVEWREKNKNRFEKENNQKLTFTPIFIEILAKALAEFPMMNSSVDGYKIIIKKNINIGMAVALSSGNLIVPVIKNANNKDLFTLVNAVNDISSRAKNNKLNPEEIQNATFTLTNLGSFGSLAGTPIINQPQVAIVAVGAIKKRPVVIETEQGDSIGIRHIMIVSMAYDHRVIDGALGGKFLNRFVQLLESYKPDTKI